MPLYNPNLTHQIAGNTAGATANIATGTYQLAGGNNITLSQDANSVTISAGVGGGGGFASAGLSNIGNTSGNTGLVSNQLVLAGGNNITLSGSTNGGSATVTVSAATQTNQTLGGYFVGNTTGQSSSSTYDARTLSFDGAGIVSAGWSAGSIRISATQSNQAFSAEGGSSGFQTLSYSNNAHLSFTNSNGQVAAQPIRGSIFAVSNTTQSTSMTANMSALSFHGAGIASVGASNGSVVVSVPAGGGAGDGGNVIAAGTRTAGSTNTVLFSNSNSVSFGLDAVDGSVMTASVGSNTYASTVLARNLAGAQTVASLGQNSLYIFPHIFGDYVSGSIIKHPLAVTNSSSAFAAHTRGFTMELGVYTRHSTNQTVLTRHYSTSYTASFSANSNGTWNIGIITGLGNSTSYDSVTASSAGLNLSQSVHGTRELLLALATTFAPGEYWFAVRQSSSTAGAAGNLFNINNFIVTSISENALGVSTNSSNNGIGRNLMQGIYSATTGALPGGISQTQINLGQSIPILYFMSGTV